MNLEESNSFVERMEKNNKNKKTVLIVLIICAILIVILVGLIFYVKYQDSLVLKVFVDDKQVSFSNQFLKEEGKTTYVNIRELTNMLGYSYQKGEYKNYTEDANSCYIRTPYEIVSMTADKDTITKYILNEKTETGEKKDNENTVSSELIVTDETGKQSLNIVVDSKNETTETITINEPIKLMDGELYVSFNEALKVFNLNIDASQENRIHIYSLMDLIVSAAQYAQKAGYSEISNIYENLTAIANGMIVVGDGKNYGVVSTSNGRELISLKYEKIVYMQNTDEFLVTAEGSVGIVSKMGDTIIKPTEYDNISVLDELNKLYLVEKDGKYGVLNGDGEIIVYSEYDSIGIKNAEEFQKEGIRNFNLIFDELIPVNVDGKTGLINKDGTEIFKPVYTLGYVANANIEETDENNKNSTNNTTAQNTTSNTTNTTGKDKTVQLDEHDNVLTIPETVGIKGIVIKNYNELYGIYDAKSNQLIPCSFNKIYSRTKAGVTTYYLEYNEQEIELQSYLEESGFLTNDAEQDTSEEVQVTHNEEDYNVVVNTVENNVKDTVVSEEDSEKTESQEDDTEEE